jgi:hypothetical protein
MRRALVIAFVLLLVAVAAPASAAPDNSPVFKEEVPDFVGFPIEFPNPCLGEGATDIYIFEGRLFVHEFTNPSGKQHSNDVGFISVQTDSGFSSPERMIGVDVENINGNTETRTGTGLYQLRNDDGQKLRVQVKFQFTMVGDEIKVDMTVFDFACLGNNK